MNKLLSWIDVVHKANANCWVSLTLGIELGTPTCPIIRVDQTYSLRLMLRTQQVHTVGSHTHGSNVGDWVGDNVGDWVGSNVGDADGDSVLYDVPSLFVNMNNEVGVKSRPRFLHDRREKRKATPETQQLKRMHTSTSQSHSR